MTCAETVRLLDAYLDNELDLRAALEVEEHVARCASCAAAEQSLPALQSSARANLIRHPLPKSLQARLMPVAPAVSPPRQRDPESERPSPARPRWLAWAPLAATAAAAALLLVTVPRLRPSATESTAADAVISAHVRSLLANHLTDVASSDQHTVKPWFQGKLDYSVAVTDFAAEGFPLVGGRLDYVEETLAASLVYKRAQHVVNLFVWPSKSNGEEPLWRLSRRGYNAHRWSKDGMHYWAVSDLNETDLAKFVALVRGER